MKYGDYIDQSKVCAILKLVQSLEGNTGDAIILLLAAVKTIDLQYRQTGSIMPLNEIVVDMLDSLEAEPLQ